MRSGDSIPGGEPPVSFTAVEGEKLLGGSATARVLARGERMLTAEIRYPAGVASRPHVHDHESHCYILEGRVRSTSGGETIELGPGDTAIHPAGMSHSVEALTDARWIESKSTPHTAWE